MEVKLVFLYFILILIIGGISYKKIKNYEDFFIAGRQGSSLQIAGSLLATILGSSAIIGSVDFAYNVGWAVISCHWIDFIISTIEISK